ncbi:MAG TPA: non-canonical purine NTP pyrophosphatase [Gemmatimonadales bacterium]|nr:non-canonical purine NTP pyrophosphatase [Gemmatimonadales bacterium]
MTLLVATRSSGKKAEARRLLGSAGIEAVFPDDIGVAVEPAEDLLEMGETFQANARAKAEYFARRSGLPTVADDSGLEVLSLGGLPGVRSKRWAASVESGEKLDHANNAELLRRLLGAPASRRRAQYRCVLAFVVTPGAVPEFFEGACTGTILESPRGNAGFGYDPLFLSDDLEKTFGEAAAADKDAVSHRGRAFQQLIAHLAPR